MKYSIIIPVYNSEKTIKRCIDSITSQKRADVEIIIINDGSTDMSEDFCKNLHNEYNNIVYIHKENGGVSSARNSGLSVAKGKYIMFVDSDDYVDSKCFDVLDNYTKSDADYYQFAYSIVEKGVVKEVQMWPERHANTLNEKKSFIGDSVVTRSINSCWAKLYKRTIIEEKGIRFCEELSVGEDLTFAFTFLLFAHKIERIESTIYFVDVSNGESLSRKYRENLSEQLICVYERMYEAFVKSHIESEFINSALAWLHYRNAYSVANDLLKSNLTFPKRRKKLKEMCSMFNSQGITPIGLKCKIISIPIRLKLVGIVDIAFQVINKLK